MTYYQTVLEEICGCGERLVRVDAAQPENTHDCDVVICRGCFEVVRKEPEGFV